MVSATFALMKAKFLSRFGGKIIFAALLTASRLVAGEPVLLLTHAHAHNDYEHARPLFDALDHDFCSVEADIFFTNGCLLVAHKFSETKPERTLQALYLDPLRDRVRKNGGRVYPGGPEFTLLIDLKEDWRTLYPPLRAVLTNYPDLFTTFRDGVKQTNAITVILTGDRSGLRFAGEAVRWAALDGNLSELEKNPSPLLVPWISADWKNIFHWNGSGEMPATERQQLNSIVRRAHEQGRLVRFWDAPDFPNFWRTVRAADVDWINTDDLAGAEFFFDAERLPRNQP